MNHQSWRRTGALSALLFTLPFALAAAPKPSAKAVRAKAPPPRPAARAQAQLPRLVDLGAKRCIPCKMMAPVLEELSREQKGKLQVVFIDVWENPTAGKLYRIKLIPTQIFYDAQGREFYRHEGFFPKADILAKFRERGIKLALLPGR